MCRQSEPIFFAVGAALLALFVTLPLRSADANYPHLPEFGVDCSDCHWGPSGTHAPTDEDCLACHDGVRATGAIGHSSATTSDQYGTWAIACTTCHKAMFQYQFWTYGSDSYIASGTSDIGGVADYSLTMTGAGWTPDEFADYQLIPNIVVDGTYSYRITGNSEDTIFVEQPIHLPVVTTGPTDFAVIYGRLVAPILRTPLSGVKDVRFFDSSGPNSFADGDATFDGICEVCHTLTYHQNNDGTAPGDLDGTGARVGHYDGENCTTCHRHSDGFRGTCTTCHDYPPASGSHSRHLQPAHVELYGMNCRTCHNGAPHRSGAVEIAQGDLDVIRVSEEPMTFSGSICSDGCHYGAVWGGDPLFCYDCHYSFGFGNPDPPLPGSPAIVPVDDFDSAGARAVTFQWGAVPPAYGPPSFCQYRVEVSSDPAFAPKNTRYSQWITETSWSTTLATGTTWYWRASARDVTRPLLETPSTTDSFTMVRIDSSTTSTTVTTTTTSTTTTSSTTVTLAPSPLCGDAPEADAACRLAVAGAGGRSSLMMRDASPDTTDQLKWKWRKGAATAVADFLSPDSRAVAISLCLYDASGKRAELQLPSGAAVAECAGKPCWRASRRGYVYKNKTGLGSDGISLAKLGAGADGKAQVLVSASGRYAAYSSPATATLVPDVVVQLLIYDGVTRACFKTAFPGSSGAGAVLRQDSGSFRAKGP